MNRNNNRNNNLSCSPVQKDPIIQTHPYNNQTPNKIKSIRFNCRWDGRKFSRAGYHCSRYLQFIYVISTFVDAEIILVRGYLFILLYPFEDN